MKSRTKAVDLRLNLSGFSLIFICKIFLKSTLLNRFSQDLIQICRRTFFGYFFFPSLQAVVMHTKKSGFLMASRRCLTLRQIIFGLFLLPNPP